MPEAFGTLNTNMCKVFTVNSEQVTIEQALFSSFILAVFAVVQFGLTVLNNKLV